MDIANSNIIDNMEENRKATRSAGRPAIGGKRRQYVVMDDAHEWIMAHGGGKYITDTIHAIMAVAQEQK